MPCYDPQTSIDAERTASKCSLMTRLLCDLSKELEEAGFVSRNPDFLEWVERHKRMDALREERDALYRDNPHDRTWQWGNPAFERYVELSRQLDNF